MSDYVTKDLIDQSYDLTQKLIADFYLNGRDPSTALAIIGSQLNSFCNHVGLDKEEACDALFSAIMTFDEITKEE